jgi:hypothetical protein
MEGVEAFHEVSINLPDWTESSDDITMGIAEPLSADHHLTPDAAPSSSDRGDYSQSFSASPSLSFLLAYAGHSLQHSPLEGTEATLRGKPV